MRKLRESAAQHGRTAEAETREILRCALADKADAATEAGRADNLWDALRRVVEPLGGVDLELPPRELPRKPPFTDED
jgi:plasmid stability protein